jgi:predicted transcriptional regulator
METKTLLSMTTDIVAAHASANELSQEQLLSEIQNVFGKLAALGGDGDIPCVPIVGEEAGPVEKKPAVPLDAAFGSDKVFCMVCGKGMKTLKRHIKTSHNMMPGQYRKTFGVPAGTPLVAKNYSNQRKALAKDLKLADRLVKARAAKGKKKTKK